MDCVDGCNYNLLSVGNKKSPSTGMAKGLGVLLI
jgi:hypothetical protein